MTVQNTLSIICITALYLCFPVIYFLFSGGIYTYCYGSGATWTESACSLIRNDAFIISNFTLLLLLTISSCYIALVRLNKLQVVSRFLLHLGIPLFIINVLGFFNYGGKASAKRPGGDTGWIDYWDCRWSN